MGGLDLFDPWQANGRKRRILPVAECPDQGPVTEPAADARPRGWELLFLPLSRHPEKRREPAGSADKPPFAQFGLTSSGPKDPAESELLPIAHRLLREDEDAMTVERRVDLGKDFVRDRAGQIDAAQLARVGWSGVSSIAIRLLRQDTWL